MEKKAYHHENLRQELIDAGVKIVAQEGIRALSLRRLAAECNVSHAAPYKHFKNKDDILAALTQPVQQLFAQKLLDGLNALENSDPQERLVEMGVQLCTLHGGKPGIPEIFVFHRGDRPGGTGTAFSGRRRMRRPSRHLSGHGRNLSPKRRGRFQALRV